MQSGDHHVLIVTRIPQQSGVGPIAIRDARHVLVHSAGPDLQFRSHRAIRVGDVQIRTHSRSAAEHRVQIKRRRAGIGRDQRILRHPQLRGLIKGDVVIGELADERRPSRHRLVVGICPVRVARARISVDRRDRRSTPWAPPRDHRRRPSPHPASPPPSTRCAPCQWHPRTAAARGTIAQSRRGSPAPRRAPEARSARTSAGTAAACTVGAPAPAPTATETPARPAPAAPMPFKNSRRDGTMRRLSVPMTTPRSCPWVELLRVEIQAQHPHLGDLVSR